MELITFESEAYKEIIRNINEIDREINAYAQPWKYR